MNLKNINDIDLNNKKVVVRVDLNVPMNDGIITDLNRITTILPTILALKEKNAAIILLSHLGRPQEGAFDLAFSLEPIAHKLSELLNFTVRFEREWVNGVSVDQKEVVLCENVRFEVGEEENSDELANKLALLGDVFVMDAFATAHRMQASTYGIAKYAQISVAGPLLLKEIAELNQVIYFPKRPLVAIIGGAKVANKLQVLRVLMQKVDCIILGGGIANTFLAASGVNVGNSLYEKNLINSAKELLSFANDMGIEIVLPQDVIVANKINATAKGHQKELSQIQNEDRIVDFGVKSIVKIENIIHHAETIFWNGPLGVFEFSQFAHGTKKLTKAIAEAKAFCVAGGGDTVLAINKFSTADKFGYISTGGGALLEYIEKGTLPGIEYLAHI